MNQTSLTGTQSFAARLLRSERWRIILMIAALLFSIFGVIARRILGGAVMTVNAVFVQTIAVLMAGLIYQFVAFWIIQRHAREGAAIPNWQRLVSAVIDLAVPGAALLILQLNSPRGAYAALSGPSLLLMPLVILLSILRLRPWFSLGIGISAALIHVGLVFRAITIDDIAKELYPVVFSYSLLIAVTGAAAAVVSWLTRRYVIEAVAEATAAELAQRAIAAVEQDLKVARDIQMGLLPSERPTIPGYDVAGMARPAAQAGGDYFDWQPLPDGRLVVVIADVTGHGIGPALVMAVCRAYARASAPTSTDPELLLARLNDLICEDVKGKRFITMAVAVVNADGAVELVSAGHGPTLLYRAASHEIVSYGGDGLPLGIMRSERYGPKLDIRLESGDILVLLTDGFSEYARSGDGELFGDERLGEALKANAALPSDKIIAAIDEIVKNFANGAAQADDMTAVVIKRN